MTTTTDEVVDALVALLTASGLTVPATPLAAFRAVMADWAFLPATADRLARFVTETSAFFTTEADGGPDGNGTIYFTDPVTGTQIPRLSYQALKAGMARGDAGLSAANLVASSVEGALSDGEVFWRYVAPAAQSFTLFVVRAEAAPSGAATITLKKNGATVGQAVFAPNQHFAVGTLSPSTLTLALDDLLTVTAPTPHDATLADVAFTLFGS